jgi:hypothetical protein
MSESTLNLKLDDIRKKLARFAGWVANISSGTPWSFKMLSTEQQDIVNDSLASGLRRFYFPTPTDQPTMAGYEWSFLKPIISLDFAINTNIITLPAEYVGVSGTRVTIAPSGTQAQPYEIKWTNEGKIRELYSITPTLIGPPMYVTMISTQGTSPRRSQVFQFYFFPTADQEYTIQTAVTIAPDFLTENAPYAYGGPAHAETVLESCLAVMEERLDDQLQGSGPHAQAFQMRLMASITIDRRNKPPRTGYNSDLSDERHYGYPNPWWHFSAPAATYNGGSLC